MAKSGLLGWLLGGKQEGNDPSLEIVDAGPPAARVQAVDPAGALEDRFIDGGEIASGGMGTIHRVWDRNLLRNSAMKVLKPEFLDRTAEARRFVEEAQITGQLDHPNIVPVHEIGTHDSGALYFTMKLVQGKTLAQELHDARKSLGAPSRLTRFLEIFIKVCDAVSFAHSRGVVHRDLKPSNVMVGDFGQVYVMDWGLARLLRATHGVGATRDDQAIDVTRDLAKEDLDGEGIVVGSLRYMAPEQALGHNKTVDERADVFSLGALLYHILTGRPPYDLVEMPQALRLAQSAAIKAPEEVVPPGTLLPHGLGRVAMKALAARPDDRYQSVLVLKSDVELYLRGGSVLPTKSFKPGELVVKEGDPGEAAYIITQGTCQAWKHVDGEKVVLRRMSSGEVFGETSILSASPRSASVEALDDVTVMEVTARALTEGVGMNSWMGVFVKALAERFREADERLTQLEHEYLTYLKEER